MGVNPLMRSLYNQATRQHLFTRTNKMSISTPPAFDFDSENLVIQLCMAGNQAEFQGRKQDASALFMQAWHAATDDYEACIAAHYVARFQETHADTLRWNEIALHHAEAAKHERVKDFYASLYVNLGHSHALLGNQAESQKYYALAAALGITHQEK